MLHAPRAHMLLSRARPSTLCPGTHHQASVLPRGAGVGARHRARGAQQHHRHERDQQEFDSRAAAEGVSRARRRTGADAIHLAHRCTSQQQGIRRARKRQQCACTRKLQEHAHVARAVFPHAALQSPSQHDHARDTSSGERPVTRRRYQSTETGARGATAPPPRACACRKGGRAEMSRRSAFAGSAM